MSDIALINRDISISSFGDILIANDDDDIIQMAINNVMTIHGTNEFHPNLGNKVYNQRHKISQRELLAIANESKNAILQDSRVINVIEIIARDVSTPDNIGAIDISFVIETDNGRQLNSNVTITAY